MQHFAGGTEKGGGGGVLAGARGDLSITVKRKPAVGSGIPVASLLWVLWLSLCGPPQKCQPLSLTHSHSCLGLTLPQYCIFS